MSNNQKAWDNVPVAWAAVAQNGQPLWLAYDRRDAEGELLGMREVVPLYRQPQPTLTDDERKALQRVLRLLRERYYGTGHIKDAEQIGAVIDGLLARAAKEGGR